VKNGAIYDLPSVLRILRCVSMRHSVVFQKKRDRLTICNLFAIETFWASSVPDTSAGAQLGRQEAITLHGLLAIV
jgi:hypothetical protein